MAALRAAVFPLIAIREKPEGKAFPPPPPPVRVLNVQGS